MILIFWFNNDFWITIVNSILLSYKIAWLFCFRSQIIFVAIAENPWWSRLFLWSSLKSNTITAIFVLFVENHWVLLMLLFMCRFAIADSDVYVISVLLIFVFAWCRLDVADFGNCMSSWYCCFFLKLCSIAIITKFANVM